MATSDLLDARINHAEIESYASSKQYSTYFLCEYSFSILSIYLL
jgi:hypothetical protein